MKPKIGIIYSTVDGHTLKICKRLNKQFAEANIPTQMFAIEDFKRDISGFKTIVVGASIRYGKHNKLVTQFFNQNKESLQSITTAFFSVNLVARKEEKSSAKTNPYLLKFLKTIKLKPDMIDVFGGKLYYPAYPFLDRLMIKLIMKITHGPLKTDEPIEYTNWQKVHAFGEKIIEDFKNQ